MTIMGGPRSSSTGHRLAEAFVLIHRLQPNLVLLPNFVDWLMNRTRTAISGIRGVKLGANAAFELTEFAERLEVHVTAPPAARAAVTRAVKEELRFALGPSAPNGRTRPRRPSIAPPRPGR